MPKIVVPKYVQLLEFGNFLDQLALGTFWMGALKYWEAVLKTQPLLMVKMATVPAVLPPPRFEITSKDLNGEPTKDVFEDPPHVEKEADDKEEDG